MKFESNIFVLLSKAITVFSTNFALKSWKHLLRSQMLRVGKWQPPAGPGLGHAPGFGAGGGTGAGVGPRQERV